MQDRREVPPGVLQRLSDPTYRLFGEDVSTATVDDARRWADAYDKLVAFKRELLDLCHKYVERSEPEVAQAIKETDVILLEMELSRFEQKRDFWRIRASELGGNGRRAGTN